MTYNGWANYHTWNVSLHIANDYYLYTQARDYAIAKPSTATYDYFITYVMDGSRGDLTPDGVSWTDPTLDHDELDAFIMEMGS